MENGGMQVDGKMRVGKGLETIGAVKMRFNVRSVSSGVMRELHE